MLRFPLHSGAFPCKLVLYSGKEVPVRMENQGIPVMINLLSLAKYPQMPPYPIQLVTVGQLRLMGDGQVMLNYTESDTDEESGEVLSSEISLTFTPGRVTMVRLGDITNTMVFVRGQRYEGPYVTPYGEMNMAVHALDVSGRAGPEGGNLHLKYQLYFDGQYASTNELHLEFAADRGEAKNETAAKPGKTEKPEKGQGRGRT